MYQPSDNDTIYYNNGAVYHCSAAQKAKVDMQILWLTLGVFAIGSLYLEYKSSYRLYYY
jgi:hypothetical protein